VVELCYTVIRFRRANENQPFNFTNTATKCLNWRIIPVWPIRMLFWFSAVWMILSTGPDHARLNIIFQATRNTSISWRDSHELLKNTAPEMKVRERLSYLFRLAVNTRASLCVDQISGRFSWYIFSITYEGERFIQKPKLDK